MDRDEVRGSDRKYPFELRHAWLDKPWVLAARSEEERRNWVEGLRRLRKEAQAAMRESVWGEMEGGRRRTDEGQEEEELEEGEEEEADEGEDGHLGRLVWPGYEEEVGTAMKRVLEFAEVRDSNCQSPIHLSTNRSFEL